MAVCCVRIALFFLSLRAVLTASTASEFEAVASDITLCPGEELALRCHTDLNTLTNIFLYRAPGDLVVSVSLDDYGRTNRKNYTDCPLGRALYRSEGTVTFTSKEIRLSIPYQSDFSGAYKCKVNFKDTSFTEKTVNITSRPPQCCPTSETATPPPQPGTTTPMPEARTTTSPVPEARTTTPSVTVARPNTPGASHGNSGTRVTHNYVIGICAVVINFVINVMIV